MSKDRQKDPSQRISLTGSCLQVAVRSGSKMSELRGSREEESTPEKAPSKLVGSHTLVTVAEKLHRFSFRVVGTRSEPHKTRVTVPKRVMLTDAT